MAYMNGKHIPFVFSTVGGGSAANIVEFKVSYTEDEEQQVKNVMNLVVSNPETPVLVKYTDSSGESVYLPSSVSIDDGSWWLYAVDEQMGYAYEIYLQDENITSRKTKIEYGTYSKPTDGIPKSDLASDVQTSLSKADTINSVPDYVKSEAEATIKKSFSHGNLGRTLRFIAISDAHNDSNGKATTTASGTVLYPELTRCIRQGNEHCGQAVNYIANRIGLDFIAFLGDTTWAGVQGASYSQDELKNDIFEMWSFIADGFKSAPQIRCVGNHDQYLTSEGTRLWNAGAYSIFGRYCSGKKDNPAGYGYFDIENSNVRVIYLNTSDLPSSTVGGTKLDMTQEQVNWLAETLLEVGDKTDWKILILSHAPLDLINKSDVLTAYANGTTYGSYDFANHNSAQLLANVHGHVHCYSYGYIGDKVRRFTIPNACYGDNNHYGGRSGYEDWNETVTYHKTADSGKDTAFSLVTIDLDSNMCYVDNYGAGIDREFSCDYYTPPIPSALFNLDRTYVAGTTGESVGNALDETKAYTNVAYGATTFNDRACAFSDVSENSVTVTESGLGGIVIAYPIHLPDLATQDYTLSFDYSGSGKQRAYYKLCTDSGSLSALTTVIDDTAGASGTKSVTISAGGQAYTWLIVMLSSNTSATKSYTNVTLTKAT